MRPLSPPPETSMWKFPLNGLSTVMVNGADWTLIGPVEGPVNTVPAAVPLVALQEVRKTDISVRETIALRNFIFLPFSFTMRVRLS